MKGSSADRLNFNISSFQFTFIPLQITAINPFPQNQEINIDAKYIVQLQKGAQIIKRCGTKIQLNKALKFYFSEQENVKLKIFNPKSSSYCLAIYRQQDWQQNYVQSLKLQFFEAFESYVREIRDKVSDYRFILEKIEQKEEFGVNWKNFKAGCTKHHQILSTKNRQNLFQLKYLIQIKSQIDYLVQNEQPKIKFKPKRSNESERRSNSSITSKSKKNQQNSSSTIQKSIIRCQGDLKMSSQIKEDKIIKTQQSVRDFSPESAVQSNYPKEDVFIQSLNPTQVTQQSQEGKPIPFIPLISIIKKNDILSDIVEASYEGDSQMNSGGDRTDRRFKEMPLIKEQDERGFFKTKTYHFLNKPDESPIQYRRNNSLNNLRTAPFSKQGISITNNQEHQQDKYKQYEDYETNYQTNIQSADSSEIIIQKDVKKQSNIISLILLMVLIYAITTVEFLFDCKSLEKMGNFRRLRSRGILKTRI